MLSLTQPLGMTLMAFHLFAPQFPTHLTLSAVMKVEEVWFKIPQMYISIFCH